MDAMTARELIRGVQNSFQVLSVLQLVDSRYSIYPPQPDLRNNSIPCYDIIVVGGGTAGCVVASRLAEDGKTKVLLIEAGGNPPLWSMFPPLLLYLKNTTTNWNYEAIESTSCTTNTSLALGKVLGGTSTTNFMLYSEGGKRDYDNWASIVNDSSWNADSVRPYFSKSQQLKDPVIKKSPDGEYFGYDGNIKITKDQSDDIDLVYTAFGEAGFLLRETTSIKNPIGFHPALFNIGDGVRQSTANTYISPMKSFSNLQVLRNALVTKFIFNKKKAVAVKVVINNEIIIIKANLEIVVSAGAVNTAKLLMLSGIGPSDTLRSRQIKVIADLPVGQNLQHLPVTNLIFNLKNTPGIKPLDIAEYPASAIFGFAALNKSADQPDYMTLNFLNYASRSAGYSVLTHGFTDQITNDLFSPCGKYESTDDNRMMYTILFHLSPKTRGEVTLGSTNPEDQPIINITRYSNRIDLEDQVRYIEDFFRFTKTAAFKELGGEFLAPELEECKYLKKYSRAYWTCYANCMASMRSWFAGTTAMGKVVDSRLRVKGVKGLRVADASVMPVMVRSLPLGAVVMIGEKAADMIKKDNKL